MTIISLGTGGAYCLHNFHSNFLVSRRDLDKKQPTKYLLVDCGSDIRMSLSSLGFNINDIDAVWITHCHPDHAGGLVYLAYQSITRSRRKIMLYATPTTVQDLWRMLEPACKFFGGVNCKLTSYFNLTMLPVGEAAIWDGLVMTTHPWVHVCGQDDFRHPGPPAVMHSFGLTLHDPYNLITTHVVGDMAPSELSKVDEFIKKEQIDLMLLDCYTGNPYSGPAVHPPFCDIVKLSPASKQVIKLVHYGDEVLANWDGGPPGIHHDWYCKATDNGLSFMNVHQQYNTAEIRGQIDLMANKVDHPGTN